MKTYHLLLAASLLPSLAVAGGSTSSLASFGQLQTQTETLKVSAQQQAALNRNYTNLDGHNVKLLSKSKPYSYVVVFEAFQSWEGDGPEEQIKQLKTLNEHVHISMVQPNMNINPSVLAGWRKDFSLQDTNVLLDPDNKLVSALGAWQTPTHFLFDYKGNLLGKTTGQDNKLVELLKLRLQEK